MLIVFEGIDGTGKSTHARTLARRLREGGAEVVETREPSDSPAGREIRRILAGESRTSTPAEELELFHEDRREHVARVVRPALARGALVVQDRSYYSTAAYQGALGLDVAAILERSRALAPEPDLLLLFLLDPQIALERIQRSGRRLSSFERVEYLERVQELYCEATADLETCRRIDAAAALPEVEEQVLEACRARLGMP